MNIKLNRVWSGLGGCAANISYGLSQSPHFIQCAAPLGTPNPEDSGALFTPAGDRFALPPGIHDATLRIPGQPSQAFVVTDPLGDQRTYFAPGSSPSDAAWEAHLAQLTSPDWVIQAPLEPNLMLRGLTWGKAHGATTVWSPGQYSSTLTQQETALGLAASDYLITNRHENEFFASAVHAHPELCQVTTNGAKSITLDYGSKHLEQAIPLANVVDPTGCGDAFVAGFVDIIASIGQQPEPTDLGRALAHGVACAQACLSKIGCQNHPLTPARSAPP